MVYPENIRLDPLKKFAQIYLINYQSAMEFSVQNFEFRLKSVEKLDRSQDGDRENENLKVDGNFFEKNGLDCQGFDMNFASTWI